MDFFLSDTHFGHFNIIRYCNRPFKSVEEMDESMIHNINSAVKSDDTLWHLGDFCFGPRDAQGFVKQAEKYRNRINCNNIILIWGNHDPDPASDRREERIKTEGFRRLFSEDYDLRNVKINDQQVVMCHYAMKVWDKSHRNSWCLYGHSHGTLPDDPNSLSFDVGVDCHDFKPLSFDEVGVIMSRKTYKPIDRHGT